MKNINNFACGVLFALFIIPILNNVVSVVDALSESFISIASVKITKDQAQIHKIKNDVSESNTNVIGFCVPDQVDADEADCDE